jgi:hypothetical protein
MMHVNIYYRRQFFYTILNSCNNAITNYFNHILHHYCIEFNWWYKECQSKILITLILFLNCVQFETFLMSRYSMRFVLL